MRNFVVLFLLCAGGWSLCAQTGQGRFLEITGTVEIKTGAAAAWSPAAVEMEISRNTVISTGFKSMAVIALGNSTLTIRPLTKLTLEEILQKENDEEVSLYLDTGRVRAEVSPPPGGRTGFSVRSASVTASVRGTAFEFDTRHIQVDNGRVLYSGVNGQQVYVDGNERSYVDEAQNRVVPPFEAAAAALAPAIPELGATGNSAGGSTPVIQTGTVQTAQTAW
ncbi:hypothetical protein AGMMS50268_17900 [Spirochaetia bacterium]|nr:hypothetical protein AGMMS50268_17900 [Spirochaetia bacterium]